jgi:hypothetical protein
MLEFAVKAERLDPREEHFRIPSSHAGLSLRFLPAMPDAS